jgi:hypothetical protein
MRRQVRAGVLRFISPNWTAVRSRFDFPEDEERERVARRILCRLDMMTEELGRPLN